MDASSLRGREANGSRTSFLEPGMPHGFKSSTLFRRSWAPADSSKMEMKADVRSLAEEPLKERIGVDPHVEKDKTSNTLFPLITLDCDPAIRRLPSVPQERHIVLDVKGVRTLFGAISAELERYGLARIPANVFSCNTEVTSRSSTYIRILIRSYLEAISPSSTRLTLLTFQKYVSEGAPTDLAIVLRWGLGHLARREGGYYYRGLISWKVYEAWRRKDRSDFDSLANSLPEQIMWLFRDIVKFLARVARASRSNGLTPEILSALFGVLIFGPSLVDPVHEMPGIDTYYKRYMRSARALQRVLQLYMREEVSKTQQDQAPHHGADFMERTAFVETMDQREFPREDLKTVSLGHIPPKNYNVHAFMADDATLVSMSASATAASVTGTIGQTKPTTEAANISDLQWADFSEKGFGGAVDTVGELTVAVADITIVTPPQSPASQKNGQSKTKPGGPRGAIPFRPSLATINGNGNGHLHSNDKNTIPESGPEHDWATAYSADAALTNPGTFNTIGGGTTQTGRRYELEDGFVDCFMFHGADWFDRADCIFDNVKRVEVTKPDLRKKSGGWKTWVGKKFFLQPRRSMAF